MEEREAMPEQIPPSPCYLCSEMCYDNPALSYNSELHLLSGEWPCREGDLHTENIDCLTFLS